MLATLFRGSFVWLLVLFATHGAVHAQATAWTASWTASPQPAWDAGFALPMNAPPHLQDQTIRQLARLSLGGSRLRIVLSNHYGREPLVIGAAHAARSAGGAAIVPGSDRAVTFGGRRSAQVAPGAALVSDPIELEVPDQGQIAVSIYLPQATRTGSFHWDARHTAYLGAGNQAAAERLAPQTTTSTYLMLSGIEVDSPRARGLVVALGDSITDGNGAGMDADARWPDFLAARLAPRGIAVLNAGISGGRLLADGMGASALARFERDVLSQLRVQTVIVLIGINDIAWPGTAFDPAGRQPTAEALIAGYRQLIGRARSRGVRIVGATLTPFEGALAGTPLSDYYNPAKDGLRQRVNAWIRNGGEFDAVLDFDAWTRDPAHPARFLPALDSGDHLHPGNAGNRHLADAIDLDLLLP
jgi:lysophospholipase L1-like esterase